jgi:hypothetical protein
MDIVQIPKPRVRHYTPNGLPISTHFGNLDAKAWYFEPLRKALHAIDSVHGDGFWQHVRIDVSDDDNGWRAGFHAGEHRAWLFVHADQTARSLDLIHELGHGLEAYGFQDLGFRPSAFAQEFEPWRQAIAASQTYQTLFAMQTQKTRVYQSLIGQIERAIHQETVVYCLEWHELFARSYAQYIALHGDQEMRLQISEEADSESRELLYPMQWQSKDFDLIAEELERLLFKKGWLI